MASMSSSPSMPPPVDPAATPEAGRRQRRVLLLTSTLALVAIAGVIVFGFVQQQRREAERRLRMGDPGRDYSVTDIYGDPLRNTPWPDAGCAPDRDHPPKLVFLVPEGGLDFGAVRQGAVLQRTVRFRNDGVGPLCIRRIERNCGCIQASFADDARRFEPGEEGALLVELNTRGREGPVEKHVTLHTNSPDEPRQGLVVKADVSLGLVVGGSLLNFGKATSGRKARATLRLKSPKEDDDWTVESVTGTVRVGENPLAYPFEVREVPDPRQRVLDVVVEHPGYTHQGPYRFEDRITIRTTHPERREIQAEAWLMIVPPIRAQPPRAVLGYVPNPSPEIVRIVPGEPSVTFRVTGIDVLREDGTPAASDDRGFEATYREEAASIWVLEVRYDDRPRPSGETVRRTLLVRTDSKDVPEIRVECFARVS